MADKLFRQTHAEVKDLQDGNIEAVVATESLDRDGEILSISGLDTKNYKNNPVVLWAHRYDQPPIGKAESIKKSDGKLVAKIKFAITESDFAKEVYALYKGGFLNAFSIGFLPKEIDENIYTKSEMLEFSAVPVPANPQALMTAKTAGVISETTFKQLAGDTKELRVSVDTKALEEAIGLMTDNIQGLQKELQELKALDAAGASPRKKRVRLVNVRKRLQSEQTLAQAANRGLAKLKSTRSIRTIHVSLK